MDYFSRRQVPPRPKVIEAFPEQADIEYARSYPPNSMFDTIGAHGTGHERFIENNEIHHLYLAEFGSGLRKEAAGTELRIGSKSEGGFFIPTRFGPVNVFIRTAEIDGHFTALHLVPQNAMRACAYACEAMILLDACSREGVTQLSSNRVFELVVEGNLGLPSPLHLNLALEGTGIEGHTTRFRYHDPIKWHEYLSCYGPAAVGIGGEIGGHCIVLSNFTSLKPGQELVSIRDPFHAWDIEVSFQSLLDRELALDPLFCSKLQGAGR